jgi:phosphate uptake regulator
MVARFYERLGDHAVNFSLRVLYIATGQVPDHRHVLASPPTASSGEQDEG